MTHTEKICNVASLNNTVDWPLRNYSVGTVTTTKYNRQKTSSHFNNNLQTYFYKTKTFFS